MFLQWATIIGMVGVIGSLVFSGWQTRELIRQRYIQNALALTTNDREPLLMLQSVLFLWLKEPGLRGYLYDGIPLPKVGPERVRAETVLEMMADVLASAITSGRLLSTSNQQAWVAYARFILESSPAMVAMIDQYPDWWPELTQLRRKM